MVTTATSPTVTPYSVPLTRSSAISKWALLCGILSVVVVLACHSWVEIGYIDDWSTARTAQLFAQTGHFVYNGWLHSPEGWQIVWAAPFIKIFGFSYTVVRFSMLPIVFATVYVFQRCLVNFGLTDKNASFGALTLGLSPIFVPVASSYMTDIPSLFALILCLFFCQKSVAARTDRGTCTWLTLAATSNLVLGTVRQTGWLGVLVIVPCVGLWLRRRTRVARVASALTAACSMGVVAVLHWFLSKPYSVRERLLPAPFTGAMLVHLAGRLAMVFFFLMLSVLPILSMFLMPAFRLPRKTFWLAYFAFAAVVLLSFAIMNRSGINSATELANIAGKHQTIKNLSLILVPPATHLSLWAVTAAVLVMGLVLLLLRRMGMRRTVIDEERAVRPSWAAILWLLGPYSLIYLALLMPRGSVGWIWDRYIVALAPLPIVSLLALYQQRKGDRTPVIAVIVLALLALFGVARAERLYSENHARLTAANVLRRQGIPRTAISGGFEYDYETETDVSGHVNEPDVTVPPNSYRPYVPPAGLPQCAKDLVSSYTPSVVPKYFLVSSPRTCLTQTKCEPVSYKTLLPPFHRYIYIQQLPAQALKSGDPWGFGSPE